MMIREYMASGDLAAVKRIWREVGWIDSPENEQAMEIFLQSGRSRVALVNGTPECMVNADSATLRYLSEDVPLSCVTGVTTSRIARRQGIASRLAADLIAREAEAGADVAMLGIFDQGFYNQLGFGNGSYVHDCTFDPARLTTREPARIPVRLGTEDWERVHASRVARHRTHGNATLLAPEITRAEQLWSSNGFGLGYLDERGAVTHHIWLSAKNVENGPYRVAWMSYRSKEECLELFSLLRSLGDQVCSIRMQEPAEIQLQDLLEQPFRSRQITEKSPHENRMTAAAYWQIRLLDLQGCLSRMTIQGEPVRFNLKLYDPISSLLPEDASWRGLSGTYRVTLSEESEATAGSDPSRPTLEASINAFSRLWLGIRSATSLSWSDTLSAPPELLHRLDRALLLPRPCNDWDF